MNIICVNIIMKTSNKYLPFFFCLNVIILSIFEILPHIYIGLVNNINNFSVVATKMNNKQNINMYY